LESLINISKKSPISELVSYESLKIIFKNLPKVIEHPKEIKFRKNMAWASTLAGIAIAHRGTTTAHAIAEVLGGITNIPHSYAVAISTIPVLRETISGSKEKLSSIYQYVFQEKDDVENNHAELFVDSVEKLIRKCELDRKLKDDFPDISKDLPGKTLEYLKKYKFRPLKQHPIEFSDEELLEIIKKIIGT